MKFTISETFLHSQHCQNFLAFHEKVKEMVTRLSREGREEVRYFELVGKIDLFDEEGDKGTYDTVNTGIGVGESYFILGINALDTDIRIDLHHGVGEPDSMLVQGAELNQCDPKRLMDIVVQFNPDDLDTTVKQVKDWLAGNSAELA